MGSAALPSDRTGEEVKGMHYDDQIRRAIEAAVRLPFSTRTAGPEVVEWARQEAIAEPPRSASPPPARRPARPPRDRAARARAARGDERAPATARRHPSRGERCP